MEPHFTDTRLIRTLAYFEQFCLFRRKAHIFSLTLARLIWTQVNTDTGHFSVTGVTRSHTKLTALRTLVICALNIFICRDYLREKFYRKVFVWIRTQMCNEEQPSSEFVCFPTPFFISAIKYYISSLYRNSPLHILKHLT